ncbi:MAG: hypothetical protein LBQ51_10660 [Desulfovibrio sp.]|nr:hypothetical protein [Desulfovibrio sp.]
MNGESEIFERLNKLDRGVARIEAKLDERCTVRANVLDDHSARLRKLEESEHKRKGSIAALLGMLTAAGAAGAAAIRMIGG